MFILWLLRSPVYQNPFPPTSRNCPREGKREGRRNGIISAVSAKAKISGSVVAGFPSPAEQYQEPPLDLNELLVKRPAATYFVRVEGDSMSGAGISDGDLLVVDRSLNPADGDIIIASVDGEFTVKTYRRDRHGIRLEPANPAYPAIYLTAGQELDYFGKVTACIHRFAGKR
ncbi:MAG: translesion error-prone DNA polymerase V autoproteolytic subunit [Kiritimatiellae bacterium]|nr:translesion error-prone DNA polymerase V autoproteolytic subunit [Kiritimatiellia bacterium]